MTSPGNHPSPDPELLAAYLDGEFEGRDGLDDLRRQVEGWLESDPAAQQLARDYRRLRRVCAAARAEEVSPAVWARLLNRVRDRATRSAPVRRTTGILSLQAALAGLAAALLFLFLSWSRTPPTPPAPSPAAPAPRLAASPEDEDYILPVARADEVAILQVEGNDIATLVVGRLPLQGLLELVSPEEFSITSMEPAEDNMIPEIFVGTRGPMIWARAPSD